MNVKINNFVGELKFAEYFELNQGIHPEQLQSYACNKRYQLSDKR